MLTLPPPSLYLFYTNKKLASVIFPATPIGQELFFNFVFLQTFVKIQYQVPFKAMKKFLIATEILVFQGVYTNKALNEVGKNPQKLLLNPNKYFFQC